MARRKTFTLIDFRKLMKSLITESTLQSVLRRIPGLQKLVAMVWREWDASVLKVVKEIVGVIDSMTPQERDNPTLIGRSRSRRIAKGSGCREHDVWGVLKAFNGAAEMFERLRR